MRAGLGLLALCVCWSAFVLVSAWYNKLHWNNRLVECLINLRKSWVVAGQPPDYTVEDYHRSGSSFLRLYAETNHYLVEGRVQKGLFAGEYVWDGKPVVFLITQDGVIYEYTRGTLVPKRHKY